MKLTKNFSLAEFTSSQTASRLGLDNTPPAEVIENLKVLAVGLELVRNLTRSPITISSGYRSPEVNAAVGGSKTSQHMKGQAADILCPKFGDPKALMTAIVKANIPFDQCLLEFYKPKGGGWVHISFTDGTPRQQALVIDSNGTRTWEA